MRTSHIITASLLSAFAMTLAPAFADQADTSNTVVFELDLTADETAIYNTIRQQARQACANERKESSVLSRAGSIRKCQKHLIANVVDALDAPGLTVLAKADGVKLADS